LIHGSTIADAASVVRRLVNEASTASTELDAADETIPGDDTGGATDRAH